MNTKSIDFFSRPIFFNMIFRINGSYNSLNGVNSTISNLDTFCVEVYQKDTDCIFSEIRNIVEQNTT